MEQEKKNDYSSKKIYRAIRFVSLRNLILPVISVAIALSIYYVLPFRDAFTPMKAKSSTEAIKLYNQGHKYVSLNIDKLYYTGFDIMAEGEVTGSYYYEIADNKCTFYILSGSLVKDKPQQLENVSITAKMKEPDGLLENMITAFSLTIGWTAEGVSSASGTVVMDQTGYYLERYVAGFVVILADIIYSMVFVTMNIIFILMPGIHISLLRYYAHRPFGIKKAIKELEQDFEERYVLNAGNMYITENFFFNLGKKEVNIISLKNIVLGYEHSRLISIFGIHLKMKHTLYFMGIHGEKIISSEKNTQDVMVVMDYLKENYPDIIWGHTKENKLEAKARIKEHNALAHSNKHKKNIE